MESEWSLSLLEIEVEDRLEDFGFSGEFIDHISASFAQSIWAVGVLSADIACCSLLDAVIFELSNNGYIIVAEVEHTLNNDDVVNSSEGIIMKLYAIFGQEKHVFFSKPTAEWSSLYLLQCLNYLLSELQVQRILHSKAYHVHDVSQDDDNTMCISLEESGFVSGQSTEVTLFTLEKRFADIHLHTQISTTTAPNRAKRSAVQVLLTISENILPILKVWQHSRISDATDVEVPRCLGIPLLQRKDFSAHQLDCLKETNRLFGQDYSKRRSNFYSKFRLLMDSMLDSSRLTKPGPILQTQLDELRDAATATLVSVMAPPLINPSNPAILVNFDLAHLFTLTAYSSILRGPSSIKGGFVRSAVIGPVPDRGGRVDGSKASIVMEEIVNSGGWDGRHKGSIETKIVSSGCALDSGTTFIPVTASEIVTSSASPVGAVAFSRVLDHDPLIPDTSLLSTKRSIGSVKDDLDQHSTFANETVGHEESTHQHSPEKHGSHPKKHCVGDISFVI